MPTICQRPYSVQPELAHLHPVIRRIYEARGITKRSDIQLTLSQLADVNALKDIHQAAKLVGEAVRTQARIVMVGDYDADGATSCALAVRALRAMGVGFVDYIVPDRFRYGYGLTPKLVDLTKTLKPDLIITVDNGISSVEGVAYAKAQGIKVLITDHHLPGAQLPKADVIINPNLNDCGFPSKCLAGVGVTFYVMAAIRAYLTRLDWFEEKQIQIPNLAKWLDLVALGTVADVVPFDKNNRILVSQGLKRMQSGECCEGIKMLARVSGRNIKDITAQDLGFSIAPRLNAAGRLEDMRKGVACLISDDEDVCEALAQELHDLNDQRRQIEKRMGDDAKDVLAHVHWKNEVPNAICLYDETWHEGVIGILAGRLKERYHRPVVIFACSLDKTLKGSARSIDGVHIKDVFESIASRHPDLILKYGGHAMAAGLSLLPSELERFKAVFQETVEQQLSDDIKTHKLLNDGSLQPHECSLELAELLNQSGPWGPQFPEPMFEGVFRVLSQRYVGQVHLKLNLAFEHHHYPIEAIAFNAQDMIIESDKVRIVYRLTINAYMGLKKLQLVISHLESA